MSVVLRVALVDIVKRCLGILYPYLTAKGFDLPRTPPMASIRRCANRLRLRYRLSAVVLSASLRLRCSRLLRSTCGPGSPAAATGRDRGSPPRASNLSCAARLRAGLPGTSPHPSQHALNSGSIRCLISRSEAAHNASVSSTDAVRTHDLRISVTHGLRKLHRRQLQG